MIDPALSRKAKEAIKTALAMTIAYGIALSMDWDKPMWAGFAVAFISLSTMGQSLNKAAMRMLGTLVATIVSLTIIGLFAQERWPFMVALSLFVGFCTYKMGASRRPYFWNVCGFVSVIICLEAGPDSANAFETALQRVEETGLGILVYSLVAALIWPISTRNEFDSVVRNLASTQHQVYRDYLDLMNGQGNALQAQTLRKQEIRLQSNFNQLLDAAVTDSYEVWEVRQQWWLYRKQAAKLIQTMELWRESFTEVQTLDLEKLLPGLRAFATELNIRLQQIARMLANKSPTQSPQNSDLHIDAEEVHKLSHFHKAALAVTRSRLLLMEQLTRSVFDTVSDIKGFTRMATSVDAFSEPSFSFIPDLDRLESVVRVMTTLWLAYFAVIYINDLPGGVGLVTMSGSLGMAMATRPQLSIGLLFMPVAFSVLFAGILYIFIMPQLSTFMGLGLLIFGATFAICYLFAAPHKNLGRTFGLAMFVSVASITNEQSYSFLSVADTALMFPLIFLILAISAYIPFSPYPEHVYLRLLGRYFSSCKYLMSTLRWGLTKNSNFLERWIKSFHAREVETIPSKLNTWSQYIDTDVLTNTSMLQIQNLTTSLQALTFRVQELLEARGNPQAKLLIQELLEDVRAWRITVQGTFQKLSMNPAVGEANAFRARLDEIMATLELRIQETLDKAEEELSIQDGEHFYRLLGAYRGLSEALVDYAKGANAIDWTQWRENRF